MLFLFVALSLARGDVVVLSDLKQPRLPGFGDSWCTLDLSESHYGWSANQPPRNWVRVMIPLAHNVSLYQITGCDANGTQVSPSAYVEEAWVLRDYLYVALEYWYTSCRIFYAGADGCGRLVFQGSSEGYDG